MCFHLCSFVRAVRRTAVGGNPLQRLRAGRVRVLCVDVGEREVGGVRGRYSNFEKARSASRSNGARATGCTMYPVHDLDRSEGLGVDVRVRG